MRLCILAGCSERFRLSVRLSCKLRMSFAIVVADRPGRSRGWRYNEPAHGSLESSTTFARGHGMYWVGYDRASLQGGEMANRENTGKYGKSINYIKNNRFLYVLRGLSWGLLNWLKMLLQDVGTFSIIGQPILRTFIFWSFLTPPPPPMAKWRMGYP